MERAPLWDHSWQVFPDSVVLRVPVYSVPQWCFGVDVTADVGEVNGPAVVGGSSRLPAFVPVSVSFQMQFLVSTILQKCGGQSTLDSF